VEDVELAIQVLIDLQNTGVVTASVAVVDCGPNCNKILLREPVLVPFHHQLMGAGNQVEAIQVVELSRNFAAKQPTSATG
jgi:hypothetical protein